jgi:hypothetical protein
MWSHSLDLACAGAAVSKLMEEGPMKRIVAVVLAGLIAPTVASHSGLADDPRVVDIAVSTLVQRYVPKANYYRPAPITCSFTNGAACQHQANACHAECTRLYTGDSLSGCNQTCLNNYALCKMACENDE